VDLLRYRDLCLRGGNVTDTPVRTFVRNLFVIFIYMGMWQMLRLTAFGMIAFRHKPRAKPSYVSICVFAFDILVWNQKGWTFIIYALVMLREPHV
jgi:hypothetical protein